jgi:hypothetical protein
MMYMFWTLILFAPIFRVSQIFMFLGRQNPLIYCSKHKW